MPVCSPPYLATGKPVLLCYDYYQQITDSGKCSPFFVNIRFAANNDGKLLGIETDWSVDHCPYSEFGDLLTLRGDPIHDCLVKSPFWALYGRSTY